MRKLALVAALRLKSAKMEDVSMFNNAGKVIWTLSSRSLINLKSAATHLPVASLDVHAVQNIMMEIQHACKDDDEASVEQAVTCPDHVAG